MISAGRVCGWRVCAAIDCALPLAATIRGHRPAIESKPMRSLSAVALLFALSATAQTPAPVAPTAITPAPTPVVVAAPRVSLLTTEGEIVPMSP